MKPRISSCTSRSKNGGKCHFPKPVSHGKGHSYCPHPANALLSRCKMLGEANNEK